MLTTEQLALRTDPLLRPISGELPGGPSASADPRYEQLRSEMTKLDTPSGGEVDWRLAVALGSELLGTTSKDLIVASYTAYALLQTERWAGLAVGLELLHGLFERFWETMWPPLARLRGRGNALDWLVARLEPGLPRLGVASEEAAAIELCELRWHALATMAKDKLGDSCPPTGGVAETIAKLRATVSSAAPGAPDRATTVAPATAPESAPAAPSEATTSTPAATPSSTPASEPAAAAPPPAAAPAPPDPLAEPKAALEPLLAPLSGASPAGVEARYDAGYEAARVEIARLDSVTGEEPGWKIVRDASESILRERSKDILVASWLAFARFKLGGLDALVGGLVLAAEIIDRYWDGLFPERIRGRSNALAWLVGQLEGALGTVALEPKMRPQVLALQAAAGRLSSVVRDRFGPDAPALGGLNERVQRMLLAVPEPKVEPPKPPPPPPPPPTAAPTPAPAAQPAAAAPMPSVGPDPTNAEEVAKFLQESGRALVRAANVLRTSALATPAAYRLLRTGLYLHLSAPPPADAGGKTQIPAFPTNRRQQLGLMHANAKWEALIEESESALAQFRFCLDLHRLTWEALDKLGEPFVAAKDVVGAEVGALVRRMPQLVGFAAVDGSPLADADTKTWIGTIAGAGAATDATAGTDTGDELPEARALLVAGKGTEALALAKRAIDATASLRRRFARRLALALACLDTGNALLARGMFAALEHELRERGLAEWEPELAGRTLEGFVRSIRAAAKTGAKYEGADAVFERLCLVDPAAAARLATGG